MSYSGSPTSRRNLLAAIATAPVLPIVVDAEPINAAPGVSHFLASTIPISSLNRSLEGRRASQFRYHNAEGFYRGLKQAVLGGRRDQLYQAGIVIQLTLSSHLFDVGFTDEWCARHIGLYVSRSLAYANATGFGFRSTEFDLFAAILSPYGRWRFADRLEHANDQPFTRDQVLLLTRSLLDQVREVTGHPRPRGWRDRHG